MGREYFRSPWSRATRLGVALALLVVGCGWDRPDPIPEDRVWIQCSTDQVIFEQAAFDPASITPTSAEVRLVYAGAEEPSGEPLVSVAGPGDGPWVTALLHAEASGWAITLRPLDTESLAAGTYPLHVDVGWEGAANSPVRIEVTFVIRPHPGMWQPGQPSVARRYMHTTTALADGGALAIGGRFAENQIERFDPATGRWAVAGTLEAGRWNHTATLLENGKVFVAGGQTYLMEPRPEGTWEIYDPASEEVITGPLCAPRSGHAAVLLRDGRVLLVGGDFAAGASGSRSAEIFDPWTLQSELVGELHGTATPPTAAALLPDGRVLVTNRTAEGEGTGAELFDPNTRLWTETAPRHLTRDSHAMVVLEDGRALVVGGAGEAPFVSELYDPASETWSTAGSVSLPHYEVRDAAVLLPGGRVLVAGGSSSSTGSAVEIYDPSLGAWSLVGSLGSARQNHTVTVLADGRVVAVGGWPLQDRPEFWREPSP